MLAYRMTRYLPTLLLASALLAAPGISAKTLRFASAFDPNSLDPHSLALLYQSRVVTQIYEGLVNRDQNFKLEPSLAVSWEATTLTTWRFKLRPNVKFHDGASFSADDLGRIAVDALLTRTGLDPALIDEVILNVTTAKGTMKTVPITASFCQTFRFFIGDSRPSGSAAP